MEWTDISLFNNSERVKGYYINGATDSRSILFNFTHCHVSGNSIQTLTLYVQL